MCLQAAHVLQELNPLTGDSSEVLLTADLTTMSLMFIGLLKATMGGLGMASLHRLEECRMGRYLWMVVAIEEWEGS